MASTYSAVGQRTRRLDSPPKLTGAELFTADVPVANLLHARIVGSTYAHASIRGVDATAALAVPGVVAVLTNDDLPIKRDDHGELTAKLLAGDEALYVGHPIALVLATSDVAAQDGADLVEIDYEPLDVVFDIMEAIKPDSPLVTTAKTGAFAEEAAMHNADAASAEDDQQDLPPNVSSAVNFERGDVDAGFAEADAVVELSLSSLSVHQGYIEPQVALATPERSGRITVRTSTQGAFHGRGRVANTLGIPIEMVNIVAMPVGGGFGGKFVLIEPLVAAAAVAVDQPVLLAYTRTDDLLAGNPAPECKIDIKLGATSDGTFTALQAHLVYDSGNSPGSPIGISAILLGGYYKFPNLKITGYEDQTHRPGSGAYRAPGATRFVCD